ncbi:glycoside hydrolase family 25 protein [Sphingomonas sp.]|jgi:lysozyme|uniref:glycoside hydrolase family 25 protein n=1 Tax=Sphingomonas sp. TaxID=28214 RepID=UPI0035C82A7E
MWGLGRFVLIVAALALAGVAAWRVAIRWHPSIERFPVQGIDVSEINGIIEWPVVKGGGADFGYAVATTGTIARDRLFQQNWEAMAAAGMRRGAVLVFSFCQPAAAQADAFNTVVPRDHGALPAAIDFSYAEGCVDRPERGALIRDVTEMIRRVESHTGAPVLLRVSRAVEDDYHLTDAFKRSLWATGNFFAPGYGARAWRMWRASDMHHVEGIEGPVNWNVAAK